MNERIWEIYGASLVGTTDNGGDVLDPIKFAELIVRECAEIADHDHGMSGQELLEHFGVEE